MANVHETSGDGGKRKTDTETHHGNETHPREFMRGDGKIGAIFPLFGITAENHLPALVTIFVQRTTLRHAIIIQDSCKPSENNFRSKPIAAHNMSS